MTLREEKLRFDEEIERIEAERQDLAEEVARMDEDDPERQQKAQRGGDLDVHLDGLEWAQTAHEDDAVPQWGADVNSITLAGLTAGEYGGMEGEVAEAAERGQSPQQVQRVYQVRVGTVDAPYISDEMTETQETASVAGLPIGFIKWAYDRIDNLSSVGNGERASFSVLLAEKQAETNSHQQ